MVSIMKSIVFLFLVAIVGNAAAQSSTYLQPGTDHYSNLDRWETLSGRLSDSLFLSNKVILRKEAVAFVEKNLSDSSGVKRSRVDIANLRELRRENHEFADARSEENFGKHGWGIFYHNPYDFVSVKTKDFFLVINPIISGTEIYQSNAPTKSIYAQKLFSNGHGVEARGWISKKLSFYSSFVDNQDRYPAFLYNSTTYYRTEYVPGADFFLVTSPGQNYYDYMQASGYFEFDAIKDHLNVTFGSGRHFIGDGISSLFLTDNSSNTPFLQLNAKIWKLDYECLYLELMPQYFKPAGDKKLSEKFTTMHYVSYNALRWLNVGFFESVVFDRPNTYEVAYLNPMILTIDVNHSTGNGDKSLLGFFWKAIAAKRLQFYGQFMLNEFKSSEFFGHKGWWGNKWGMQLGGKYFNAFGIKNLDLQGELDMVRPYTYTAKDTTANYTNYNQPLADPLGSGFIKGIGTARLQATPKLSFNGELMYYVQGMDTGTSNLGNNIFNPYVTRPTDYGIKLINGPQNHCEMASLNISYRLLPNLYLDLGGAYRNYVAYKDMAGFTTNGPIAGSLKSTYVTGGLRLNIARRSLVNF